MSTRSDRIKALIEQSGQSYQELEKATGVKKSSLQRYASGATTKIPLDVIEKLAKAFHVSQEYLMGWSEDPAHSPSHTKKNSPTELELSEGERMLIKVFRQIPAEQRKVFLEMGRVFANSLKKE